MDIQLREIDSHFTETQQLYAIYEEAFPEIERIPTLQLLDFVRGYGGTPWAVYDADELVGFTAVLRNDRHKIGYIWYLAVSATKRSHGYGSKILSALKRQYADCQLVLDMEQITPDAPNYEQRLRRLAFYQRNGFERAKIGISYFGIHLELMCQPTPFRFNDFKEIFFEMPRSDFRPTFYPLL